MGSRGSGVADKQNSSNEIACNRAVTHVCVLAGMGQYAKGLGLMSLGFLASCSYLRCSAVWPGCRTGCGQVHVLVPGNGRMHSGRLAGTCTLVIRQVHAGAGGVNRAVEVGFLPILPKPLPEVWVIPHISD